MHDIIVIGEHIVSDLFSVAVRHRGKVVMAVEVVVAETYNHLLVMVTCPIPKIILGIRVGVGIWQVEICGVACDKQNVTSHLQRMISDPLPILRELKMQVADILDAEWVRIIGFRHSG